MKAILTTLMVGWICLAFSQTPYIGTMDYVLTVKNSRGQSYRGAQVIFTEVDSRKKVFKTTDALGKVKILLEGGREWLITVEKIRNEWSIEMPERGQGSGSRTVSYNYERWKRDNRPPVDRAQLGVTTITQNIAAKEMPTTKEAILNMHILRKDKSPLRNFKVGLTSYKYKKTYEANTDSKGVARFRIPLNSEYEIDIDGIEEFEHYDIGNRPAIYSCQFVYEPSNVKEAMVGDTITQFLEADAGPTSGRAHYKLKVKRRGQGYLKDEPVYLKMLKSNKVYKAKTNKDGEADFLLPIHRKYMIDFNFEKDVDVLDLARVRGLAQGGMELTYRPDPKLEHPEQFIPRPNQVFLRSFDAFLQKQFPEPTENYLGLYAKWANPEFNENSKEAMLEIGFASQKRANKANSKKDIPGPPINVAFVIDKSGSMAGYDRIESLIQSMLGLVEQLRPTDIVSLVVFNENSQVLMPAKAVGNGKLMKEMIQDIVAGGGTEIYTGLEKGFKEVLKNFDKEKANKVVLLTDGFGSRSVSEMVTMARSYTNKGIELSCIGVGQGYNQALLSQLATVGGGMMHYVGQSKNMDEAFNAEMKSTLYPIAKNATIEVFYHDKLVFRQLYGYEHEKKGSGKFNMDINHIYPGLNKLALVHFDMNNPTRAIEKSPVRIKMSYHDYELDKQVVQEKNVKMHWMDKTGEIEFLIEKNHKKLYATAVMNRALKVMAEAHAEGNSKKGKAIVQSTIKELKEIFPKADDADVKQMLSELDIYVGAFDQIMYNLRLKGN